MPDLLRGRGRCHRVSVGHITPRQKIKAPIGTTCAGAGTGANVPAASSAAAGTGETVVDGGARVCPGLAVREYVRFGNGCVAGTGARGRIYGEARAQTGAVALGAPSTAVSGRSFVRSLGHTCAGSDVSAAAGAGAGASVGETVVDGGVRIFAGLDVRGIARFGSGCIAGAGARVRSYGEARAQTGTVALGAPSTAGNGRGLALHFAVPSTAARGGGFALGCGTAQRMAGRGTGFALGFGTGFALGFGVPNPGQRSG